MMSVPSFGAVSIGRQPIAFFPIDDALRRFWRVAHQRVTIATVALLSKEASNTAIMRCRDGYYLRKPSDWYFIAVDDDA